MGEFGGQKGTEVSDGIIISNGKSVGWTSVPACSSLGPLSYDKAEPLPQFSPSLWFMGLLASRLTSASLERTL